MNKQNEIKNVGIVRKWFLFLLIAPAIFFVIWFFNQSGQDSSPDTVALPQSFLEGGTETKVDSFFVKVGESSQAITSDSIRLPLNNVTVETGFSLMAFPVYLSQPDQEITWMLVDSKGRDYSALPIEQNAIAELIKLKGGVKNTPQLYLLFKPRTGEKDYFLVGEFNGKKFAWRFKGNS